MAPIATWPADKPAGATGLLRRMALGVVILTLTRSGRKESAVFSFMTVRAGIPVAQTHSRVFTAPLMPQVPRPLSLIGFLFFWNFGLNSQSPIIGYYYFAIKTKEFEFRLLEGKN